MGCQESDRGIVLRNEVRTKGLGSLPVCSGAGVTQKVHWRGKAPYFVEVESCLETVSRHWEVG